MKKFACLYVLLCAITVHSQTVRFKVSYTIGGDDNLKSESVSYVERELRSLGDVDILPKNGFYKLSLLVMPLQKNNYQSGFVISSVVSWRNACSTNVIDTYPCYVLEDHTLFTGYDLKETMSRVVTDFDIHSLAPLRKGDIFKP